ncbi:Gfo/Idh/MocA family oxidoreductase [soil metagenome]
MTFRWGILGTGPVSRKFVLGLRSISGVSLSAVAANRIDSARRFADDFKIPVVADGVEDLTRRADIDAVYVATPASLHRDHAIACIEAGKPVLVEKPFATSRADAEAIADASRAHGVFCMEGIWTQFLPLVTELVRRVEAGEIGRVRSFSGSFGVPNATDMSKSIFQPELGGGALLHRGIYPLSLARRLLGPVVEQTSMAVVGDTGVDEDCVLVLRHEGGGVSTVSAGLRSALANDMTVTGDQGVIHVSAPIYRPFRMTVTRTPIQAMAGGGAQRFEGLKEGGSLQGAQQRLFGLTRLIRGRRSKTVFRPYSGNGYHYEATELMDGVRAGRTESPTLSLGVSVELAGVIEQARTSWSQRASDARREGR